MASPTLDLPPEAASQPVAPPGAYQLGPVQLGQGTVPDEALVRGLMEYRLHSGTTVVGGYGEFNANFVDNNATNHWDGTATVRRMVLFVAHNFNAQFRSYVEFEWENALACATCAGSVDVEQAFIDWLLVGNDFALRAGLVLMPVGIVNQWHEPPLFHGVERPDVDRLIIPTTWSELGIGVFGAPMNGLLRYEAYLTTAPDPISASGAFKLGDTGFGSSSTAGSLSPANGGALVARLEAEPLLGLVAGASLYGALAGGNIRAFDAAHNPRGLDIPVVGYVLDARLRQWGFEGRLEWADFYFPDAGRLMLSYSANGSLLFPDPAVPLPEHIYGGYIEGAYDVLHPLHRTRQQLLPFVRLETLDNQAKVPSGFVREASHRVNEITAGVSYRPIQQVVFKADMQVRWLGTGAQNFQLDLGTGFMF